MNIIEQVKQTLIDEINNSIQKAQLADAEQIPEIKIEIPKDNKMEITHRISRWY